jgi:biopolymer transport protein ExbD
VLIVGAWTLYLRTNTDGRFPDMKRTIRDPAAAKARCQLSPDDMQFLAETLPKLPCNDEQNLPVTLDVNGSVAVRAKPVDQDTPTEVVLTNSQSSGEPVRININRKYLRRAMQIGVQGFCLFGDDAALLGQGENLKYIFMPLEPGAAIKPAEDCIRIESPKGETIVPVQPRKAMPVNETNSTNAKAESNAKAETNSKPRRRKVSQQDLAALIDQAVQFRSALHTLMQQSTGLVKALKQHRRQNRAIQSTLESLKQLKSLGV